MIDSTYGTSLIHRLSAGVKLCAVFFISILLFMVPQLWLSSITLLLVYSGYIIAGFGVLKPLKQLKAIWWLLIALFFIQGLTTGWLNATIICVRLATLVLLAALVTLTTPFTKMMDCFEKLFSFIRFFGGNPAKISLALSLTLRFIPVFSDLIKEVRDAQKVRGLEGNFFALIMPVLIRSLKIQDDVAAAIEARSYDPDKHFTKFN